MLGLWGKIVNIYCLKIQLKDKMTNNLIFFILWLITSKVFLEWSFSQLSFLILKKRKNGSDFFFSYSHQYVTTRYVIN